MKKALDFIKNVLWKKWYFYAVIILILVFVFFIRKNGDFELVQVTQGDFIRQVSVVGTVVPSQETNMSFEVGGKVVQVLKKVGEMVYSGDVIATLESSDINSDIMRARADLEAEEVKLLTLKNSSNTTDISIIKNEIRNGYTVVDDAIRAKTDQMFDNPNKYFPEFKVYVSKYSEKLEIEEQRSEVGKLITDWSEDIEKINNLNTFQELAPYIAKSKQDLTTVLNLLDKISRALSITEVGGNITQTTIDKYVSDISNARLNVNNAISKITGISGDTTNNTNDILLQETRVKSAQANLSGLQARLSKNFIRAPFSGVITKMDLERGEIVSTSVPIISIMSNKAFQIETFVPEVNIKDIKVGDTAEIRLDAFGEEEFFSAKVVSVDPAQTTRDGVSTYKTKFEFEKVDSRIRSGMTANVIVKTEKKENSLLINPSVVYKKDGFDYVRVLVGKEIVEKQITLGGFDAFGNKEVISGITAQEKIIKNPNN
jgi:HlyD family secretion protein